MFVYSISTWNAKLQEVVFVPMPMTYQQFQHSPNLFGDCEAYGEAYGGACMALTYGCAFVEEEFLHPQFIINSQ